MIYIEKRLKQLREEKGLKQSELGKMLQLGAAAISKYENGISEPDLTTLVQICKIFNVSSDYILALSDVPSSPKNGLTLDDDEMLLLNMIHKLPDNYKHEVKGYVNGLLSSLGRTDNPDPNMAL